MAERTIAPKAREGEAGAQPEESTEEAAPKAAAPGGFKAWLPLLVTVLLMPALAFATTQFLILPKMKKALDQAAANATAPAAETKDAGSAAAIVRAHSGKPKILVPMPKILVNVAGTMMTRYLMTSVTLVGTSPDFKEVIEANKDQLIDVANGALSTKTIQDLEQPGSRNVIRSELLTVFNNALGGPVVQDIYITEQAIQ